MKKYLVLGVALAVAVLGLFLLNNLNGFDGKPEFTIYPKEFSIYQDYIEVIGGKPSISDTGTIEATILSVTKSEVCPSLSNETCSIEPYPNDWAIIRIDKIVEYAAYSEKTAQQPVEQPDTTPTSGDVVSTPQNRGIDLPRQTPGYNRLQVGQNISAHFLLTVRPAKIRYVSIGETKGGLESSRESVADQTQTASQSINSTYQGKTFESIPKEGEYFVFTTKLVQPPETSQKTLAGLKAGDKFRAKVDYNGMIYVEEYEIIL